MRARVGRAYVWAVAAVSVVVACAAGPAPAAAGEVMQERCKQDVAFVPALPNVPTGEARPGTTGTLVLKRRPDGTSDWSNVFTMQLTDGGRVRWWCYTGPGTPYEQGVFRANEQEDGQRCSFSDVLRTCTADPDVKRTAPVWGRDWTAERSRCDDRSTKFRARLGRKRSLQIECMGK